MEILASLSNSWKFWTSATFGMVAWVAPTIESITSVMRFSITLIALCTALVIFYKAIVDAQKSRRENLRDKRENKK